MNKRRIVVVVLHLSPVQHTHSTYLSVPIRHQCVHQAAHRPPSPRTRPPLPLLLTAEAREDRGQRAARVPPRLDARRRERLLRLLLLLPSTSRRRPLLDGPEQRREARGLQRALGFHRRVQLAGQEAQGADGGAGGLLLPGVRLEELQGRGAEPGGGEGQQRGGGGGGGAKPVLRDVADGPDGLRADADLCGWRNIGMRWCF